MQYNKKFGLIGAAGFIAPKHMEAIKHNCGQLCTAYDPHDSVGVLDKWFPNCKFTTNEDEFIEDSKRKEVEYISICSPNYLHSYHVNIAFNIEADAICEKPFVINPQELETLKFSENLFNKKVHCIMQLRLHKNIIALKKVIDNEPEGKKHSVALTYITPRGRWYDNSWKGDENKSGGLLKNIGIHFFDMLLWIFGICQDCEIYQREEGLVSGRLNLKKANVQWSLSINERSHRLFDGQFTPLREISVDGTKVDFSEGFTDLHIVSYKEILEGRGFGIEDVRPSIELAHELSIPFEYENITYQSTIPT